MPFFKNISNLASNFLNSRNIKNSTNIKRSFFDRSWRKFTGQTG